MIKICRVPATHKKDDNPIEAVEVDASYDNDSNCILLKWNNNCIAIELFEFQDLYNEIAAPTPEAQEGE